MPGHGGGDSEVSAAEISTVKKVSQVNHDNIQATRFDAIKDRACCGKVNRDLNMMLVIVLGLALTATSAVADHADCLGNCMRIGNSNSQTIARNHFQRICT